MNKKTSFLLPTLQVAIIACLSCFGVSLAAPPDLTAGGVPNDTSTINLGPTGARG